MSDIAPRCVLALNAGSSTLKFGLYAVDAHGSQRLMTGIAEHSDGAFGALIATDADHRPFAIDSRPLGAASNVISRITDAIAAHGWPAPRAVGHRIVHGGAQCRAHTLINATVMQQLQAASVFAPLHMPPALALLRQAREQFPDIPHAACLDTAFHAAMPDIARTLPLPRALRDQGIQRYGFHGLSLESIVRQLGHEIPRHMVVAHLGHGASVTAVADGRSIDRYQHGTDPEWWPGHGHALW